MSSESLFKLNVHISNDYRVNRMILPLIEFAALLLEPRHCIFQITTERCPVNPSSFSGQKPWTHSQPSLSLTNLTPNVQPSLLTCASVMTASHHLLSCSLHWLLSEPPRWFPASILMPTIYCPHSRVDNKI